MSGTIDLSEYPRELRDYIARQHKICSDANQADFRPTYQTQLDNITRDHLKRWKRGQAIIADMSDAEHKQCEALYRWQIGNLAEYNKDRLVNTHFKVGQCLVPAYITQLEKARYLQPFFTVPTPPETDAN